MENRKRPSSYNKRSDNKTGDRSFKKDEKSFKKDSSEGPKRPYKKFDGSKRTFDKPGFRKEEGDDKKPFKREGGYKKEFGAKSDRPYKKFDSDRPKRTFDKPGFRKEEGDDKKPFRREGGYKKDSGEKRPYKFGHADRFSKDGDTDRKPYEKREGSYKKDAKPRSDRSFKKSDSDRPKRTYDKPGFKKEEGDDKKPFRKEGGYKKDYGAKRTFDKPGSRFKKDGDDKKPFKREQTKRGTTDLTTGQPLKFHKFTKFDAEEREDRRDKKSAAPKGPMTLNKYIAHSGECGRREAAEMVKQGKVKVNGELVLDPGYRVGPDDNVIFAGKKITPTKHYVYVLLNKPKGYITTTDDPEGRQTVMDLVEGVEAERVYPVGRLDRNTSGLLLLTNDGDLAQRLSHPSFETKKVYQVTLDRPLEREDFEKIVKGVELEDGKAKVDAISYLEAKNEIGLEIHSGKNRIVRRIFESLNYEVEKLDRVMYAGLTKKNIPRGKWRLLSEREIVLLKHFKS